MMLRTLKYKDIKKRFNKLLDGGFNWLQRKTKNVWGCKNDSERQPHLPKMTLPTQGRLWGTRCGPSTQHNLRQEKLPLPFHYSSTKVSLSAIFSETIDYF